MKVEVSALQFLPYALVNYSSCSCRHMMIFLRPLVAIIPSQELVQ